MNDFDANLIREFRSRPAFYDRNNPRFKDKVFTAREWQQISNKLGYDVSLLKDRMLQLRNRYNLEKRRIEQLREENPGVSVESPWPLFDHLHFLSEHIRARRSYKRMLTSAPQQSTRMDLQSGGSNSSSGEVGGGGHNNNNNEDIDENGMSQMNMHSAGAAGFPNGFMPVRVKMEHVDDIETNSNGCEQTAAMMNGNMPTINMQQAYHQQQPLHLNEQQDTDQDESESLSITDNGAFLTAQSAAMLSNKQYLFAQQQQQQQQQQQHHHLQQQQRLNPSAPPPLKIRRIDSLRSGGAGSTWIPVPPQQQKRQNNNNSHSNNSVGVIPPPPPPAAVPPQHHAAAAANAHYNSLRTAKAKPAFQRPATPSTYATPRELKYAAFGDFVASSLLDLPPVTAMQLIEKFTTEVVKVLIENDGATESQQHQTTAENATSACNGVVAAGAN